MTTADQVSMYDSARGFLYEFPGGMDRNVDRDEFLKRAKLSAEDEDSDVQDVIENLLRAAYFQGRAVWRAAPEDKD